MNAEMETESPDARAAALAAFRSKLTLRALTAGSSTEHSAALAALRDFDALHSRKPAASPAPFQTLTLRALRVAAREAFAPRSARPRVLHKKGQFRYA